MAKTTRVNFEGIWEYNNTSRIFRTIGNNEIPTLWVESFEDGIVTVAPAGGYSIENFAEAIAGCFNEDSNFGIEVLRAYNCDENATFICIKFEFNGVTLIVTKENADKERIYSDWKAGLEANEEGYRCEREAWLKTPEGQEYLAQQREEEACKKVIEAEVIRIGEELLKWYNKDYGYEGDGVVNPAVRTMKQFFTIFLFSLALKLIKMTWLI